MSETPTGGASAPRTRPELFTISSTPLRDSIADAIAQELARAPDDALEAQVLYRGGELKATAALRLSKDRWAVGIGGFVTAEEGEKPDAGLFGSVRVTF